MRAVVLSLLLLVLLGSPAASKDVVRATCMADVEEALDLLETHCRRFFDLKGIDWKKVERQFRKEARKVKTEQDHFLLLIRLVARLEDGHAYVKQTAAGQRVELPAMFKQKLVGPGMFWCQAGETILVKSAWSAAKEVGITPGSEIVKVEGDPVLEWLEARTAERRDTQGYSTDHQAMAATCSWGLGKPSGSRLVVSIREPGASRVRKRTITYRRASTVPSGPAFPPAGLKGDGDVSYGLTPDGYGYVHIRRCKGNLPERMDEALEALADPSGLILDFRANGGGGFDHKALMGRFVPRGETLRFAKSYQSAGPRPYTGNIVVIVDALTRSAGETASGMFKEDGRAYMIGESPTAGMSSSKKTLPLPSGLFELYVSVASNMGRFNQGRGIEGIGVVPHEIVAYDAEDLAAERDTLIQRAAALLADFPVKEVPYRAPD